MKKALVIITTLVCIIFTMSACGSKEVTHMGVNAEILEINTELKGFVVKSWGVTRRLFKIENRRFSTITIHYSFFIFH